MPDEVLRLVHDVPDGADRGPLEIKAGDSIRVFMPEATIEVRDREMAKVQGGLPGTEWSEPATACPFVSLLVRT